MGQLFPHSGVNKASLNSAPPTYTSKKEKNWPVVTPHSSLRAPFWPPPATVASPGSPAGTMFAWTMRFLRLLMFFLPLMSPSSAMHPTGWLVEARVSKVLPQKRTEIVDP